MISVGIKVYLALPVRRPLVEGHCLLVPIVHQPSGVQLDADVWEEIRVFRRLLCRMFEAQHRRMVFTETAMHLRRRPHCYFECLPIPAELADDAPIYFKARVARESALSLHAGGP